MTINGKRNFVLSVVIGLAISACGSKSDNSSSDGATPPQGKPGPAPAASADDVQGTAFGQAFLAKGVFAKVAGNQIVLNILSDEANGCTPVNLSTSQILLSIPRNQAGPFDETNLKAPKFVQVDAENPGALNGVKDFVTFDIAVLALTRDEIELDIELRDDVGGMLSGLVKAKICP